MSEQKLTPRTDGLNPEAKPAAGPTAPSRELTKNQGTNAVQGTWDSKGEAGRHLPLQADQAHGTPRPEPILHRLKRIAEQAQQYPDMQFTTLAHLLDELMLERAFWSLKPNSAPGTDRVTWHQYKRELKENLEDLLNRLKSKTYRPQPVKRHWIDKENGKRRPLGIPCLEDKVVAKAVALLLEQIYEQDFKDFSYGFRPGRSCHDASHRLRNELLQQGITCVIDCDVSSFFDNLEHDTLLSLVKNRVNDGALLRLLRLMLEAGIMEGRELVFPEKGSPQGSVISPLLGNVYLHEVLDTWFTDTVIPHCRGKVILIRYADDFIIGCQHGDDARRIMKVLPKRFAKYGLQINTEKSKLVEFARPRRTHARKPRGPQHRTFSFLGFVYYWGKTYRGSYTIKRKTEGKRISRSTSAIRQWCRDHRHDPLAKQHAILCAKLRGHYQYFGVRCNSGAMNQVYYEAVRAWRFWLRRRGGRKWTWQKFNSLLEDYPLPRPRIVHPWV